MTQPLRHPGSLLRFWQGGRDLELIFENAHLRISAIGERTARLRIAQQTLEQISAVPADRARKSLIWWWPRLTVSRLLLAISTAIL